MKKLGHGVEWLLGFRSLFFDVLLKMGDRLKNHRTTTGDHQAVAPSPDFLSSSSLSPLITPVSFSAPLRNHRRGIQQSLAPSSPTQPPLAAAASFSHSFLLHPFPLSFFFFPSPHLREPRTTVAFYFRRLSQT
ncbi:hypothetical protein HN873_024111 [Arachis hypogaea]